MAKRLSSKSQEVMDTLTGKNMARFIRELLEKYPQLSLVNHDHPDYREILLELGEQNWKGKWVVRTIEPWGTDYVGDSFEEALKTLTRR